MINAFWTLVVCAFCIGVLINIISGHQNSREEREHFKNFVLDYIWYDQRFSSLLQDESCLKNLKFVIQLQCVHCKQ